MAENLLAMALVLGLFGSGCNDAKLSRLEKQNEELKAEVDKNRTAADLDFQAKCSRDSKAWFNENWAREKDTILLNYTNHYNKAQNKCFIFVEFHYTLDKNGSWVNDMSLWDVYENSKYGHFAQMNMIYLKPTLHPETRMASCEMLDKKCKTVEEFNGLMSPYLND